MGTPGTINNLNFCSNNFTLNIIASMVGVADCMMAETNDDRSNLLDLAVKFLTNPKISDKPQDAKVTFLKKKGLTDQEIEWAVKQTGNISTATVRIVPPPRPNTLPVRTTYTWRQIVIGVSIVGGVTGIIVYWIKSFLQNWTRQEQRLGNLEQVIQQIQNNNDTLLREVQESTQAIKQMLDNQQTQLTSLITHKSASVITEQSFKTIQADISSLKGLLLNRHQFPTTNTNGIISSSNSVGIPDWQRQSDDITPLSSTPLISSNNDDDKQDNDINDND